MDYTITKKYIKMNRTHQTLIAIGTVVHETADPGASDEDEFRYFNGGDRGASAHAFVDWDSITQTIPWNERAWHAGHTANSTRIGIELCHYDDLVKFDEVWKRAVWLFSWVHINIIKKTTITKDSLMSHAEVSARWSETTHSDPVSYFAKFGKSVDDFRNEVQAVINEMLAQKQGGGTFMPEATGNPKSPTADGKTSNNEILSLQRSLNRLEITDQSGKSLAEDGILGPRTTGAVKKLQGIIGITVNGLIDKRTLDGIMVVLKKPVIKLGSRGIAVRYLQFRLNLAIDGYFGTATRAGIKEYQKSKSILVDGIVGVVTWSHLIG